MRIVKVFDLRADQFGIIFVVVVFVEQTVLLRVASIKMIATAGEEFIQIHRSTVIVTVHLGDTTVGIGNFDFPRWWWHGVCVCGAVVTDCGSFALSFCWWLCDELVAGMRDTFDT